jgi:hypothetical protein
MLLLFQHLASYQGIDNEPQSKKNRLNQSLA